MQHNIPIWLDCCNLDVLTSSDRKLVWRDEESMGRKKAKKGMYKCLKVGGCKKRKWGEIGWDMKGE